MSALPRRDGLVVDLHAHTNLSDGVLSPAELVGRARAAGVDVLALTDHDTMEGIAAAAAAAAAEGLCLLPGMEISARHGPRTLHVLALFPPGRAPELGAWQERRRALRRRRLERMLARLAELGRPVDPAEVERGGDPRRSPGRPHVARALVAAGHVATEQEAFDRWLGRGRPAHVEDEVPTAAEAIALVRRLGGLTSAAHPAVDDLGPVLPELAAAGLDGVEAWHPTHDGEAVATYRRLAGELGLLVTGGSDFHVPPPAGAEPRLGRAVLPAAEWAAVAERLDDLRRPEEPEEGDP